MYWHHSVLLYNHWAFNKRLFINVFCILSFIEKSYKLKFGKCFLNLFHNTADLYTKQSVGLSVIIRVGFLWDRLNLFSNDKGALNFRILKTSRTQWYVYRFWTVNNFCSLNRGLVDSFLKNSEPRIWSPKGLTLAQVRNLSRYEWMN